MNFHYYIVLVCDEARTRRENNGNYRPNLKVRVVYVQLLNKYFLKILTRAGDCR